MLIRPGMTRMKVRHAGLFFKAVLILGLYFFLEHLTRNHFKLPSALNSSFAG